MKLDVSTFQRLEALLAQPSPATLRYGHKVTQPGEANRRKTRLLPLLVAWAQWRCLERDPHPYLAPAKLASRLRIVQRRA